MATFDVNVNIADNALALSKVQQINADRVLGRDSSGTGNVQEIPFTEFARDLAACTDEGEVNDILGIKSGGLIDVTPQFITYTGGSQANSTLTPANIDSSANLPIPGAGFWYFEYQGTYTAAANTTGIMLDLGGSTVPFSYLSYDVLADVTSGDRGAMNWDQYAVDLPFVSSRVTGANLNRFRITGTIQATGSGIIRIRFRSEVNASAITITDVKGFYQRRA